MQQAHAAERDEQADARDGGRQHERQLDCRHDERSAAEALVARRYAVGVPTQEHERLRDERRLAR